jgi:hypothetical protein
MPPYPISRQTPYGRHALAVGASVAVIAASVQLPVRNSMKTMNISSDSGSTAEMGISLSDYLKLSEAIEGGKISYGWANHKVENIRSRLLSAGGTGTDDDD